MGGRNSRMPYYNYPIYNRTPATNIINQIHVSRPNAFSTFGSGICGSGIYSSGIYGSGIFNSSVYETIQPIPISSSYILPPSHNATYYY